MWTSCAVKFDTLSIGTFIYLKIKILVEVLNSLKLYILYWFILQKIQCIILNTKYNEKNNTEERSLCEKFWSMFETSVNEELIYDSWNYFGKATTQI